jgi:hypothetical protein
LTSRETSAAKTIEIKAKKTMTAKQARFMSLSLLSKKLTWLIIYAVFLAVALAMIFASPFVRDDRKSGAVMSS